MKEPVCLHQWRAFCTSQLKNQYPCNSSVLLALLLLLFIFYYTFSSKEKLLIPFLNGHLLKVLFLLSLQSYTSLWFQHSYCDTVLLAKGTERMERKRGSPGQQTEREWQRKKTTTDEHTRKFLAVKNVMKIICFLS